MCLKKDKSVKGIRIRFVNVFTMLLTIAICCIVFISTIKIKNKYNTMVNTMNDYSECTKAINEFRDASDFLTNQARLFVFNHDRAFLENYFFEKQMLKHTEVSLQIISMTHHGDVTETNLKMALAEEGIVEKQEFYAMKLVCQALNITENLPQVLIDFEIPENDEKLTPEQKIQLAQQLLFSSKYLTCKDRITNYSAKSLSSLVSTFVDAQNTSDLQINNDYKCQVTHLIVLIILNIIVFIVLMIFILNPIEHHIDSILKNAKMNEKGSYETRYIAKAYNALCERNEIKASLLKHKAEHDPLTGLINREAFNQIKDAFTDSPETIAYLIIDIDFFKNINDQFGHLVGDEILKKISNLLMEQFRATDYVARIGGDEFAIIMTKFGSSAVEIIQRKIDGLNTTLQSLADGLPSVSLSVGVSFSDSGFKPILIEQADKALYRVKRGGRCNCSFYKSEG